ncbi:MAG: 30S ribosomal protein S6 [Candidatus Moranbacteria bacterium]|nr:30S ribosomal protein S6 [Candidatus Moranbacteria bacterium]
MLYELFYLVGMSQEAELPTIKTEVNEIIVSEGGVFEEKEVIEKRRLAYKIKQEVQGLYIARRFSLEDPEKIEAIRKQLNLYGRILRFLISRTDDLPELTSREERKQAETKAAGARREIISAVEKKTKPENTEKRLEKKESGDDIDKKLEEILNI